MANFAGRWAREQAARSSRNGYEATGYVSDSSSSDDSVIPNGRPRNSFTSYNVSAQKIKASAHVPSAFAGDGHYSDADVDVDITESDHPQRASNRTLAQGANPQVSSATPPTGPGSSNWYQKRTMSAAARERQSQIMKERWAAGGMSHVPEKVRETKKRKASLQFFSDDDDQPLPKRTTSAVDRPTLDSPAVSASQHATTSGYSRSQLQFWEYVRPHLDVFKNKTIPKRCWVPDLLALPRVRDLEFNPRRAGKRPYVDTDDKKVAALLLHLTGKSVSHPCSRCQNGNGAFDGCVKLPLDAFPGANIKNCANCWYSHQACTNDTASENALNTASHDNHIVVKGDSVQDVDSDMEDLSLHRVDVGGLPAIYSTLSGRRYCEWPDASGEMTVMKGSVLLPDEYKLQTGSGKPWWCPVDECRRTFVNVRALGSHFPRVHYAQVLNDNLDGTFSILGLYDSPKLGNGGSYPKEPPSFPYVGSRTARLPSSSAPIRTRPLVTDTRPVRRRDSEDDEEEVEQPSGPAPGDDTSGPMWQYIKPHLTKTTSIPGKGWVKELLPLPRVRDLQWNPNRRTDFYETHPRDISCMIIQVTGEEAPSPCTKCAEGKGPFAGCVVIPRDAPPEVRARMVSCANCNYHNRQIDCSLINWVVNRQQPPWPGYRGKRTQPVLGHANSVPSEPTPTLERPGVADRHALPSNDQNPTASSHRVSAPPAQVQTSGPAGDRNVVEITRPRPPPRKAESPAILPGQLNPVDLMEMEDWEIAPGRIRFQASEMQGDMALSPVSLTSNKSIQVHNDLAVRVDVVDRGSTLRFESIGDKMRSCIVHYGKLRVKIDGEPEFTIGQLGQFKIPAGVACSVQNRLYVQSILIVNTLTVYD